MKTPFADLLAGILLGTIGALGLVWATIYMIPSGHCHREYIAHSIPIGDRCP